MKKVCLLFTLLVVISCRENKDDYTYIDLSGSKIVNSAETIIEFDDKYPIDINISDSLLFINQIQSEYCFTIVNLTTKKEIQALGRTGNGPEDLISPNFISSINKNEILIEDINLNKRFKAETVNGNIKLVEYNKIPEEIGRNSETNMSDNFIAGRKVGFNEGKMFFIYNKNTNAIVEEDFFPVIEGISDKNYAFAPTIALNENKNRVIVGMYFFDMFHVYDLTGKRMNTFCFSKNCIPPVSGTMLDLDNGYSGIIRTFSTNDYCYLFRITRKPDSPTEKRIIQIDWNGNLINSYQFTDEVSGQFFVDEDSQKLFIIRRYVKPDDNEIFEVVSYKLT